MHLTHDILAVPHKRLTLMLCSSRRGTTLPFLDIRPRSLVLASFRGSDKLLTPSTQLQAMLPYPALGPLRLPGLSMPNHGRRLAVRLIGAKPVGVTGPGLPKPNFRKTCFRPKFWGADKKHAQAASPQGSTGQPCVTASAQAQARGLTGNHGSRRIQGIGLQAEIAKLKQ